MTIQPFKHRNLPRLLLQAREAVMAHTRPSLRAHGLSDQQWRVLRVLGEHGTVETGRVAREAFILGPSLTGVLARMERDGLWQPLSGWFGHAAPFEFSPHYRPASGIARFFGCVNHQALERCRTHKLLVVEL